MKLSKSRLIPASIALAIAGVIFFQIQDQYQRFKWLSRVYVIDCTIFDSKMAVLKMIPGGKCVFFKNGDVARYLDEYYFDTKGSEEINLTDENGNIKWSRHYQLHHSMKADRKNSRLYFFSADTKMHQGAMTKFDKIVALDLKTGREIASWSLASIQSEMEKEMGRPFPIDKTIAYGKNDEATQEVSHFNSINLVPEYYSSTVEIVVNSGRGFVLFFDKDLKLVSRFWLDYLWKANAHDVQLTEEGNLLIYKNWAEDRKGSQLEIYSLDGNKLIWKYNQDPEGRIFKADKYGSVQLFQDGSFIYSDMQNGGHFTTVSANGKRMNDFYYPEIDPRDHLPRSFHTVRRMEYEEMSPDVQKFLDSDIDKLFFGPVFRIIRKLF